MPAPAIPDSRARALPAQLPFDAAAQRVGRGRLAVGDESVLGRLFEVAQPAQDLGRVGVRRQAVDLLHAGAQRHLHAIDLDIRGAGQHRRATRAAGLETGEQHGVAGVAGEGLQVVQYPAAGGHAAGGDDDHRQLALVQRDRLLDAVDDMGRVAHRLALVPAEACRWGCVECVLTTSLSVASALKWMTWACSWSIHATT